MSLIEDRAIVLRTWKLGEADRILSLLCEKTGKVRAVAKGVRRSTSKIGGRTEPYSECHVALWQGKSDLMTLSQIESIASNSALHNDLEKTIKASVISELIDKIAVEEVDSSVLFRITSRALRALCDHDSPNFLSAFFLRVLEVEGFSPRCDACVVCGDKSELVFFDAIEGGTRCRRHPEGVAILPETLRLLRAGGSGRTAEVLSGTSKETAIELEALVYRYVSVSFGIDLKVMRHALH